tara:strand:+ start:5758 stop:6753 length:996 start_codon:yes stop_codon:yes gene_type:complete
MINYRNLILKEIDKFTWDRYWIEIEFSNLLQTWEYGIAKKNIFCKPIRFLIYSSDKQPLAIVQVLVYRILFFPAIARINRGPLQITKIENDSSKVKSNLEIIKAVQLKLKKIGCFLIFISPDLEFNNINLQAFLESGFKIRKRIYWASSKLSLKNEESQLLMQFKSKWRNMLRKSLKSDLYINSEKINLSNMKDLINEYEKFKQNKNFTGINCHFLDKLSKQNNKNWKFLLYKCFKKDKFNNKLFSGMLVSVVHGSTATYLIGFSNKVGRQNNSNYLMLWHSILDAKLFGCNWYDMGGITENTTKGIAHFKNGVNGKKYSNLPQFYRFTFW